MLRKLASAGGKNGLQFQDLLKAVARVTVLGFLVIEHPKKGLKFERYQYLEHKEDEAVDGGPAADGRVGSAET